MTLRAISPHIPENRSHSTFFHRKLPTLACVYGEGARHAGARRKLNYMNKIQLIAVMAMLAAAPMVMAHEPRGTHKTYCEPTSEWNVHEYGPAATGILLQGYEDGNIQDCDNSGLELLSVDRICPPGWHEIRILGLVICVKRLEPDDDGHAEYARGGAWLLVNSGPGVPSADPNVGAGSLYCFGHEGHHANFATVTVDDLVLGAGAEVTIASDTVDLTGTGEGCGDFESDNGATSVGTVTATFPAGLDGTYQVYVQGTQGHVTTN